MRGPTSGMSPKMDMTTEISEFRFQTSDWSSDRQL
jgi:hypothetical protein